MHISWIVEILVFDAVCTVYCFRHVFVSWIVWERGFHYCLVPSVKDHSDGAQRLDSRSHNNTDHDYETANIL